MYRSALRAVGDPAYRAALGMQGDPFLPFGLLAGVAKKAGGAIIKRAGAILRRPVPRAIATTTGIAATGVALERATTGRSILTGRPKGAKMEGMRGRRMRVTNPKALRRALRRVSGFGKLVKRTKTAVRRAASAVGATPRSVKRAFGRKR